MLYPAELQAHINGAGDGNRTHATSLEGEGSTIELHPQIMLTERRSVFLKKSAALNQGLIIIQHIGGFVNRGVWTFFIFSVKAADRA